MSLTLISGLVALAMTVALWTLLRARARHMHQGVEFLREYRSLVTQLLEHEMPDHLFRNIIVFSHIVGSGFITRRLFSQLAEGKLAEPVRRDLVQSRRADWEGFHSQTRILYVRTFFSGLRADSYFAGVVRGTLFRRAVFYLNADPAEVAYAVDAMETKILVLGAERAAEEKMVEASPKECKDLLTAGT